MTDHALADVSVLAAVIACTCCVVTLLRTRSLRIAAAPASDAPGATIETVAWEPPSPTQQLASRAAVRGTAEGVEMNLDKGGVVKRARIAAMNDEHRELVLIVNGPKWIALSAAARQQAAIAARATWAAKVCSSGPDVAYVTIVTDAGDMVAQADPRAVRVS
ncbi:MAG: hypothetical protein JO165_05280 [Candidatus Eremiobacteraeota bacterium]|nr:hypothetical protein [Candidatus Eremiobacteraeota bacterium]